MTTKPPSKPIRGPLLQGNVRPFSLARVKPAAIVSHMRILELVEPLQLSQSSRLRLQKGVAEILRDYLGEVHTRRRKADHAGALRSLLQISRLSANLAAELNTLSNEYLVALEEHRGSAKAPDNVPKFDMLHLTPTLERLAGAAERAAASYAPRSRGAPRKAQLDHTMTRFRDLFAEFRLPVELRESGSREQRRRLGGKGGALLLRIFQEFDVHTGEAALWGSWQRISTAGK